MVYENTKLILSVVVVAIGIYILIPTMAIECNSAWVRSECYASSITDILSLVFLAAYFYWSIKSNNWAQQYIVGGGIILSVIFYYLVSLSPNPEIPTLFAFELFSLIYVAPMLLILQWIANRVKKKAKKQAIRDTLL